MSSAAWYRTNRTSRGRCGRSRSRNRRGRRSGGPYSSRRCVTAYLQTAVAAYMEPSLEAEFDECSFAYRRGRSVRMAVERVYQLYHQGYRWLVDADIEDFFSSVNRELAIGRLATLVPAETANRLVRLSLDFAVW